jgi:aspartate racemase
MKHIGIIGGLGPEATVDYYKEIIGEFKKMNVKGELNYPDIIIYSVNLSEFMSFLENKDYPSASGYIAEKINKLKDAGADFAAISANTPHLLFKEIKNQTKLPIIDMIEAVSEEAQRKNLKTCGLIGTKFTMNATFYQHAFNQHNIKVIVPDTEDIEQINNKLFTELELGIFKESTKKELLSFIEKMIKKHYIDSLILGCTEFPIMFPDDSYLGIPFLNTTRIHVKKIVHECINS